MSNTPIQDKTKIIGKQETHIKENDAKGMAIMAKRYYMGINKNS